MGRGQCPVCCCVFRAWHAGCSLPRQGLDPGPLGKAVQVVCLGGARDCHLPRALDTELCAWGALCLPERGAGCSNVHSHKVVDSSPSWLPLGCTYPENSPFRIWKRCWSVHSSPTHWQDLECVQKASPAPHPVLAPPSRNVWKVLGEPFLICACLWNRRGWVRVPLRSSTARHRRIQGFKAVFGSC